MTTEVILPQLGFSMSEGELLEWLVEDGGQVEEGANLFTLETDKATQEVESPATGTLRIQKQPGLYDVGTILAVIE